MRKTTIRRNKKLILLISVVAILILALTAGTSPRMAQGIQPPGSEYIRTGQGH